ncbi:tryptophanyl-tRNA synthetase [Peptococcaceae bacterium DYL19]|nr:tryptophan--tRNA ligase [Phosphitispora fastidiosa]MBU7005319.1 tryptophanyl-tRNA synthetase [Phosphitispora fastidiosa]
MSKGTILSGMRPTGRLHIGHLSVLENWVRLQDEYKCYFMIADLHSLTTKFDDTTELPNDTRQMVLDWLSVGIDPVKNAVFVQSSVREHAELHLCFSMNAPLAWLERCPTYKDQLAQFEKQGKDITTYGFLGYPLLQAADILVYLADTVPVGEDQLPHIELTREIARRFNFLYKTDLFPEPKALLGRFPMVPGVDGRKMSKSYGNNIAISATTDEVKKRVNAMVTDPQRIRKEDPGHPEVCIVHKYQEIYNNDMLEYVQKACRGAERGCVSCKKDLLEIVEKMLAPLRERRAKYENSTYNDLRQYIMNLKEHLAGQGIGQADAADKERKPETVVGRFKEFSGTRKEKNYLSEIGQSIIDDYMAGLFSESDVRDILDAKLDLVNLILIKGSQRARVTARDTIKKVREAMNLRY